MSRSYSLNKNVCSYENLSSRISRLQSASRDHLNRTSPYLDRKATTNYLTPTSSATPFRKTYRFKQNTLPHEITQTQVGKVAKNTGIRKYNNRYANIINEPAKRKEISYLPLKHENEVSRILANQQSHCNIFETQKYSIPNRFSENSFREEKRSSYRGYDNSEKSISRSRSSSKSHSKSRKKCLPVGISRSHFISDFVVEERKGGCKIESEQRRLVAGRVYTREEIMNILSV